MKQCRKADKGCPMSVIGTKELENIFVIRVNGIMTFNDQKEIENRVDTHGLTPVALII